MNDKTEIKKRYQIIKDLCDMHYSGKEHKIYLVGSRVRDDSTDKSDWDFIIKVPDDVDTLLAPRGRLFVNGECITYMPRKATGFNLFSFASVDYELSAYDVAGDELLVGKDDAAFLAAREAAWAAQIAAGQSSTPT